MTKQALIIAISQYNQFENLEETTNEAEKIAEILDQYGDYEITRLPKKDDTERDKYKMKSGQVTDEDLYDELKLFLTKKAQNKSALIYFTGHGFTICDRLGREKGFLATSNSKVTVKEQQIIKQENAFPLEDLDYLIEQANLSEFVLLLDCCYSGIFIETKLTVNSLTTFEYKMNYYLITASRFFESAMSNPKAEYSIFSGAIIEGLSDKNKDEKGNISCDRLFDFVNTQIGGMLQTPMRMGIGGSITLVKYPLSNVQNIKEIPEIEPIRDNDDNIVCPYQGLNVFEAKDKEFFFGRQRLTEDIKQKLEEFGVIPIIGASGSGKSSVVRAGVMAWLDSENKEWRILPTIKPGYEPLDELKRVFTGQVSSSNQRKLLKKIIEDEKREIGDIVEFLPNDKKYFLFIDQFEEVFTLCSDEWERKRFIDLITQITVKNKHKFAIITTMRADFLDNCLHYRSLYQIIQDQVIYMPPLEEKDIQDIIIKPAQRQGYEIENDLLLRLLSDVGKKQGFLPLLEFALTLLWEKRDEANKILTLDAYEKLGEERSPLTPVKQEENKNSKQDIGESKAGLTKALNIYAEKVYENKGYDKHKRPIPRTKKEKELIKLIFLRLIRSGNQAKDTRQRQPKTLLLKIAGDDETQQEALNELIDGEYGLVSGRLLVTATDDQNHSTVDLVHEALIEGWQRFKLWRGESRNLRQLSERLDDQRQQWLKNPIDENLMMGGLLMQVRQQWDELRPFLLHPTEDKEFYQKSDDYEQKRIAELNNLNQAIANAKTAIKLENEGLKALDQLDKHQPTQALLTAIKAGKALIPLKQADGNYPASSPILALNSLWYKLPRRVDLIDHQYRVKNAQFSPDSSKVIIVVGQTYEVEQTAKVWDISGKLITTLEEDQADIEEDQAYIKDAQFSPDNSKIVTVSSNNIAKVWDISGKLITTLEGHQKRVTHAQFNPDNSKIVTVSHDGTAKIWDISGKLMTTIEVTDLYKAQFSSDSSKIVGILALDYTYTAKVWDISGKLLTILEDHQIGNAQFSPDGTKIVTASFGTTAKVWDISGKLLTILEDHQREIYSIQFSPDGTKIVTASEDKTAKVWDISGKLITTLEGHSTTVKSAKFSPDGSKIITLSETSSENPPLSHTVKIWDISRKLITTLEGHQDSVYNAQFSRDGSHIVTLSKDKTAKIWDIFGQPITTLLDALGNKLYNCLSSSYSNKIVTVSNDYSAKIWDTSGKLITTLEGHQSSVNNAQFSRDGSQIVTASSDKTAKVWDSSGKLITTLEGHKESVYNAQFSRDGTKIVTASFDKTPKVWDSSGKLITTLEGHRGDILFNAQFSPDGNRLLTLSIGGRIKVWDVSGQLITAINGHSAFEGLKTNHKNQHCQHWVNNAQFSRDGSQIVTVSNDKTAKIWDSSGKLITTLEGHKESVNNAQFSQDGSQIVTVSNDKTAKIWDSSGKLITTLEGHQDSVNDAQFSQDDSQIVTASDDGTAKIWPVHTLEELVSWGCEWLKGNLPSYEMEEEYEEICKS
ncbi:MAG: hypothetical protein AB4063_05255 [Crocosphaera sp.]